jgi:hypothetical protein
MAIGKNGFVQFPGDTAVCAVSWSLDISQEEVDITNFCSEGDWRIYQTGFKSATGSFTVAGTNFYDLLDETGTFTLGDDSVEYSGSCVITGMSASSNVDGRTEQTWNFRCTGAVTINVSPGA